MTNHVFSALCDTILGSDRNAPPNAREITRRHFSDSAVCKHYLVSFCPYDLFPNTRSSIGSCNGIHDRALKEAYEKDKDHERYSEQYEHDMYVLLEKIIRGVRSKIEKAHKRIEATLADTSLDEAQKAHIDALNQEVSMCLAEAQAAGEIGDLEKASSLNNNVNMLKREIESVSYHHHGGLATRDKSLRVCSICGALQSVGDTMARFESHVSGKQHIGHEKVLSFFTELEKRRKARRLTMRANNTWEPRNSSSNTGYSRGGAIGNLRRDFDNSNRSPHAQQYTEPFDRAHDQAYAGNIRKRPFTEPTPVSDGELEEGEC